MHARRGADLVAPDELGPALAAAGVFGVASLVLTLTLLTPLDHPRGLGERTPRDLPEPPVRA